MSKGLRVPVVRTKERSCSLVDPDSQLAGACSNTVVYAKFCPPLWPVWVLGGAGIGWRSPRAVAANTADRGRGARPTAALACRVPALRNVRSGS